jgi:hypothetical protein
LISFLWTSRPAQLFKIDSTINVPRMGKTTYILEILVYVPHK